MESMHDYTISRKPNTKNSLSIRLTESAVFLRTDGAPSSRRSNNGEPQRSAMLRGLLVLDLVKATKITSIDVELTAITSNAWPEGVGASRIEITEKHRVFHASSTFFHAETTSHSRRTASIGPGIFYNNGAAEAFDNDNIGDEFDEPDDPWDDVRGGHGRADESVSEGTTPGVSRSNSETLPFPHPRHATATERSGHATTSPMPLPAPRSSFADSRYNRRVSVDNSHFQPMPLYETYHEEGEVDLQQRRLAPIPPYSPFASSSVPNSASFGPPALAAHSLEDFRNSLHAELRSGQLPGQATSPPASSSARSLSSMRQQEQSLSRHSSLGDVIPEYGTPEYPTPRSPSTARSPTPPLSSRIPQSFSRTTPSQPRSQTHSPSASTYHPLDSHASTSTSTSTQQPRGRKGSRFSFSAVSNVLIDAVRSGSPRTGKFQMSRERGKGRESLDLPRRNQRESLDEGDARGRTMERGAGVDVVLDESRERVRESKERGGGVIGRMLRDKDRVKEKEKDKDKGKGIKDGWKEFKKGTYTYPISFSIPGNAPPTMTCDYGTVSWRLKANVHRPGAFKAKMTAVREVVTIACPTEEDTEDTENIIVERHWDSQLQYLISISGRSFYVGGTVPVTLTMMPLAKIKIYRLSVYVEERVDYYTNMRRIARSDPITRFTLLSIKGECKGADPILPLDSEDPEALRNSPLFALISPTADLSETASTLMGPGPWTFHQDLKLPGSCDTMKFTNRNRRSNITVTHVLKLVMRVERGDDLHVDGKTGKRKLFDIVVQTPVLILSCRCNPEWTSLPRYCAVLDDSTDITPSCPCHVSRMPSSASRPHNISAALERMTTRQSSDSGASAAETSPVNAEMRSLRQMSYNESILRSSSLFERLISGQESENGEAPPAYHVGSPSKPVVIGVNVI
ncbi:hypothetical protein B0H34DRAFT_796110 [Crassisporium funariophilum]|nr:hypothetical protein B0H34DRAFT_796110 [Crassisporium funariophilum]